jgi:hypothetical protein
MLASPFLNSESLIVSNEKMMIMIALHGNRVRITKDNVGCLSRDPHSVTSNAFISGDDKTQITQVPIAR